MSAEATTTEHTNPFDVPEKAAHESNPEEGTSDALAVSANRLWDERRAGQPWTEERQGQLAKLEAALITREPAQNDLEGAEGQPVGKVIEALGKDLNKTHPELGLRVTSDWTSEPTEREWLSPDWLPSGRVSMLTGHGGTGKSLLSLQLAATVASGAPPSKSTRRGKGIMPMTDGSKGCAPMVVGREGPVVIATWEEEASETLRRLDTLPETGNGAVRERLQGRLHVLDLAGRGALWGPLEQGHRDTVATLTQVGGELETYVRKIKPRLLVIDPVAGAFGGNENDRAAVRAWLAHSNDLAAAVGCAVLLIAHPPKGPQADVYSGSTDWRNGVRSLWSLSPQEVNQYKRGSRQKARPAEGIALTLEKSNYARAGRKAWVRFRVEHAPRSPDNPDHVLTLLAWEECGPIEAAEAYHRFRGWPKPERQDSKSDGRSKRRAGTPKSNVL